MAVQALIANADGFFTLAYNYSLFLDPSSNRFVFIPGDQELSFANFLMMGSADQLMDMSLARPYDGENRLADRLLAIKDVRDAHQKIIKDFATTVFRKDRLLAEVEAIEGATKAIFEARGRGAGRACGAARRLWPPGGTDGPRPADVRREAVGLDRRSARGKERRLSPSVQFRAARRRCTAQAGRRQDDRRGRQGAPRIHGAASSRRRRRVGYPVTLSVAPDGAVYVAVDEQGSLGRTPGGGRVVPLHRRRRRRQGRPRERVRQDGASARRDRAGRQGLGPAPAAT